MKITLLSTIFFFLYMSNAFSQVRSKEAKESMEIIWQSDKLRKEGKISEADKMLLDSNEKFPNVQLEFIANDKMLAGDIRGANKLWDALIESLKKYSVDHKNFYVYRFQSTNDALDACITHQIFSNFEKGDPYVGIKVAKEFLQIERKETFTNFQEETCFPVIEACYQIGDLENLNFFIDLAERKSNKKYAKYAKIYRLMLEKKYDDAIAILTNTDISIGEDDKISKKGAKSLLPLAYYGNGDTVNLKKSIDEMGKNDLVESLQYYQGLLALSLKNYDEAIVLFSEAMKPRRSGLFVIGKRGKFRYYTYRAEAYVGLKDYVNARKDFEAALVYNQNYEPALNGLAKLESTQIVDRRIDKTGPEIKILEPANARGLEVVTAGKDVMIKGLASDPSGLKSVTINKQDVYIKEGGDFWGSVVLKDGTNSFEIIAIDMAGNSSAQTITIEKTSGGVPVAAVEKSGKNYAVFIASQNYDDTAIPSLENPVSDAIKLKLILKNNYNFADENLYTLFNPQRDDFKKKFFGIKRSTATGG